MSIIDEVKSLAKSGFRQSSAPAPAPPAPAPESAAAEAGTGAEKAEKVKQEDVLEDLWSVSEDGEQAAAPPVTISGALTREKLQALADSQDFSKLLPPDTENLTQEQLNTMAKAVYTTALQHSGTLVDGLMAAREAELEAKVQDTVKDALVNVATQKKTEALPKNAEPLVRLVSQQIKSKFPGASPDWIAEQATKHIREVAQGITAESSRTSTRPTGADQGRPPFPPGARASERETPQDWMSWLAQNT